MNRIGINKISAGLRHINRHFDAVACIDGYTLLISAVDCFRETIAGSFFLAKCRRKEQAPNSKLYSLPHEARISTRAFSQKRNLNFFIIKQKLNKGVKIRYFHKRGPQVFKAQQTPRPVA